MSGVNYGPGGPSSLTVNLNGANSSSFPVSNFPQYLIYFSNLCGSTNGATVYIDASYNNGSSWVVNWNWVYFNKTVNNIDTRNNADLGNQASMVGINNLWHGASAGTNGYWLVGGTSFEGINKRLTISGVLAQQSPASQELLMVMGQTQDDSHQYNRIRIRLSAGTFKAGARLHIQGNGHGQVQGNTYDNFYNR